MIQRHHADKLVLLQHAAMLFCYTAVTLLCITAVTLVLHNSNIDVTLQ